LDFDCANAPEQAMAAAKTEIFDFMKFLEVELWSKFKFFNPF